MHARSLMFSFQGANSSLGNKPVMRRVWTVLILLCLTCGWGCTKSPDASATPAEKGPFPTSPLPDDGLPVLRDPEPSGFLEHDQNHFTQGLLFSDGHLFESTGREGESKVLKLDPKTGETKKKVSLRDDLFGEGLAEIEGKLFQLTWRAGLCLVYDRATLEPKGELFYGTQGWGLTVSPEKLLVFSDGSSSLRFMTPDSLVPQKTITVTDGKGQPVSQLNELEWVKDEIWVNIWMTDGIARVDPETGKVKSWIQLSKLVDETQLNRDGVLNGIAYDEASDTLWLTGKLWPRIYRFEKASQVFGF